MGASPDDWFPQEPRDNAARVAEYEARARALCRCCPVQLACLEDALAVEGTRRSYGIRGGLAPWERRRIARARAAAEAA